MVECDFFLLAPSFVCLLAVSESLMFFMNFLFLTTFSSVVVVVIAIQMKMNKILEEEVKKKAKKEIYS